MCVCVLFKDLRRIWSNLLNDTIPLKSHYFSYWWWPIWRQNKIINHIETFVKLIRFWYSIYGITRKMRVINWHVFCILVHQKRTTKFPNFQLLVHFQVTSCFLWITKIPAKLLLFLRNKIVKIYFSHPQSNKRYKRRQITRKIRCSSHHTHSLKKDIQKFSQSKIEIITGKNLRQGYLNLKRSVCQVTESYTFK